MTIENKVLEVRKLIEELIEETTNTRRLSLLSGVDQSVIYKLTTGQKSFDNLSLNTVEKLYRIAIEYKVRDAAVENRVQEEDLLEVEEIEEGQELFTLAEYGQYGWNFEAINKGKIYYEDGTEQTAVISYSVNEVKAPENADYETVWKAYCDDTTGSYSERTLYMLSDEEADIYMELEGAMELDDLMRKTKVSYVVDMNQLDKEVSIVTQEGDMYFEYTIQPAYLKDVDYLINLIEDEDLHSVFDGEDVTDVQDLTFENKIYEVRDFLERAK